MAPYGRVMDNTFVRHIFSSVDFIESVARDRISHRLEIMVRAIAATVARYLGSDSSLPSLRENH